MTAFKRCCAWVLALVMLLALVPGTAFAVSDTGAASLTETTVANIARDVADQVIRGGQDKDGKIAIETTPRYKEDDEVEIIVVVDDTTAAPAAAFRIRSMLQKQESIAEKISTQALSGARVEPEHQYTTLFNGFSTTVTYGEYQKIRELSFVKSVFLSPMFDLVPSTANSNRMIGGGLYNQTGFDGQGMVIAILDTGVDMNHQIFSKAPTAPSLTKEGLKQLLSTKKFQATQIVSGLSVEDLYKSEKFPFQFDYGDRDKDGSPGEKGSHGTHVASTAAGCTGINNDVMGVAPEAQIVNMNVFKSSGGASYADILCALEDCIALGVDVANMSLGSDCGYIDYETEDELTNNLLTVFEKVGESGVSLAVAAGNAYSAAYGNAFGGKALATNPDYGLVSEPSTYGESLSVAAVSNGMVTSPFITVGEKKIAYQDSALISTDEAAAASALRTLARRGELGYVVVPGSGTADDFAQVDVAGKVALVERGGGLYYQAKMDNAKAAGAIAMLVYNNTPGMLYMSISNWEMPSAFISQAAGEYMKKQESKVLTVSAFDDTVESPITGMADFSSWGATSELTLKPEITAPGAGIYAAVPGNSYESMDGTSMASPHVAGGMAIVQQALKERGITDAAERKHLTDTLLMSTAHIIYEENGQPYSPRKQGAGLMSINDAVNTKGYITVAGQLRPKLELKDDPGKTGVYTMNFSVHNTGNETLYYNIKPLVVTDGTAIYENTDKEKFVTSSESSVALPHTFTTNCASNRVSVAPGKETNVTVTVTLTDPSVMATFTNGAYVEGFVTLTQVGADGGELTDPIDLSVPFLAFYGDWTVAPIIDSTNYWETLDGSSSKAQQYMNTAFCSSSENTVDSYLGENSYGVVPYYADRNAISPNNDDFKDSLTGIYTGLLRNAKTLKYTITGENDEVYYSKLCEYTSKSIYDYNYYRIAPAGVDAEYDGIEPWYGTNAHNAKLANNTKATVRIEATLAYGDGGSKNEKSSWEFPITIDTEEPEAKNLKSTEAEGRYYLSFDVTDNQYVAAVIFYNLANQEMLYGKEVFAETTPGATSHVKEFDVTGMGERFGMIVHDYAGNSKTYTVNVPGNSDDHAVIVPKDVLWTENFDTWLPEDWSTESKSGSPNTWYRDWYRDEDYFATVDYDDDYQQNEWLYSRATDLSGVDTDAHMIFDFYTTYWYTVEYKHCNLQVMASDDGTNWEEIWNLQRDSGLFTAWTKTQAKVNIPEKFQNSKNLRFAFVYTGKGGSTLSIDNVVLYADQRGDYIEVDASAGEGGTITPSGKTLVKKGISKTFTIEANEGYEIENVQVDGVDQGPISYYTFERVGQDHTISVTFRQAQAGGEVALFDNDFESVSGDSFPFHGWSLKGVNTNGYTWKQQTYWNWKDVNDTKHAYISEDWGSGAQDEYLISPAVNLTGKEATLSFDYGYGFYGAQNKTYTATVEVSTDGGKTWSALWNFFDSYNGEKSGVVSGRKELAIPAQYAVDGVQFAFHYVNSTHDTGPLAVDNVKLTVPGGSSETVTLTTIAGEGGTVSPAGQTEQLANANVGISFVPSSGYQLKNVKLNGRSLDVTDDKLNLTMDQSYSVSATFEQIPDVPTVYFENDFEDVAGDSFPFHGWSLKGVNTNDYGWKQQTYWNWKNLGNDTKQAYISDDWTGGRQDEYLISPVVDLSSTRDGMLYFDYAYATNGIKNKFYNATVEVSTDGGQTWTAIWNFQDSYNGKDTGDFAIAGSAEVEIPAQYAVSGVQIAFHYASPKDTAPLAVDNVKLMAVEDGPVAQKYTITASAGEGGTITPSGEVSVKEGASQTFAIAADNGYEIADVLVDGSSVGAVESYTFSDVKANHTISASFSKTATDVEFDNDFEQDEFPGHGWTVKAENTGCTWYAGTNRNLNTTRQARIDFDYYEYEDYGIGEVQPMAAGSGKKQNEYLISPVVDLTGKTPTLSFDYLLFRYMIQNDIAKFTVEATIDGGQTWTTIWDAADLDAAVSGYWLKGTAEIEVPAAYLTSNVQFAFHFYKTYAQYTKSDGMFAVDNVKLVTGDEDPCANGHAYGEPVWSWTDDFKATATFTCANNAAHVENVTATVTSAVTTEATCETTGVRTYTAKVTFEGKDYTDTKTETLPATGHAYGEPVWSWTDDFKATATFTCANNAAHVENVTATVTSAVTTEATCETTGVRTYTAKVTFVGKDYTDTKTETLPATGHAYGEPVWSWTDDFKATATFTCANNAAHVENVPATVTNAVTTEATCETTGVRTYTAKVSFEGKDYTDTKTETVPAKGHSLTKVDEVPATCTESGKKAHWKCSECGKLFSDADGKNETSEADLVLKAKGHDFSVKTVSKKTLRTPATYTEKATYWYTCSLCGELSDSLYFEDGEALSHEIKADDTWTKGSETGLKITVDDASVTGVQIDGKALSSEDYTIDGQILTIKPEVLETLSKGKHTVTVVFAAGTADCKFTVKAASTTPKTGDSTPLDWLIAVAAVAGCGIIALVAMLVIRRKKARTEK